MRPLTVLLLTALGGCAYTQERFARDYEAALCDSLEACNEDIVDAYTGAGVDEATAQSTYEANWLAACDNAEPDPASPADCAFDEARARECLDAVDAAGCDLWTGRRAFPTSCDAACGAR
jgi:hypothetical protein